MGSAIASVGIVTPLGREPEDVLEHLRAGRGSRIGTLENPHTASGFASGIVPDSLLADVARIPRVRRSSKISLLALAAARDAWERFDRAKEIDPTRVGLVFATSDGGVLYTRKFFHPIATTPSDPPSPLFFPETVYNAPASHIASVLGLEGTSTTLVGDSTVGLTAIETADLLLAAELAEAVLVVAAEEADWLLNEAYATWGILRAGRRTEGQTALSDGAAAVVLVRNGGSSRIGRIAIARYAEGKSMGGALRRCLSEIGPSSASTFLLTGSPDERFDRWERAALQATHLGDCARMHPRRALGESLAASTLASVAIASRLTETEPIDRVVIPVLGFSGQVGAIDVTANSEGK